MFEEEKVLTASFSMPDETIEAFLEQVEKDYSPHLANILRTFLYDHREELKGEKGEDGDDGYTPVKGVDYFDGKDGYTPVKGVDYTDGADGKTPVKGVDYFDGKDGYTPIKGVDYFDGEKGDDGVGIASIVLTDGNHSAGTTDTYTVTLTDGRTYLFTVYNGANGEGAGDITWAEWKAIYDPQNKMEDIFGQKGVSSWNDLTDKPELFDGNYESLTNKPTIPTVPTAEISANTSARHTHINKSVLDGITSDKVMEWNGKSTFSGNYEDLSNKPTLFDGDYESLTNKPTIPSAVTDSHINDLIDAKLGVIENADY